MVHTLTKSLRPNKHTVCYRGISSSDMRCRPRDEKTNAREESERGEGGRKAIAFKKKMCFSFVYRSGIDIVQAIIVIT